MKDWWIAGLVATVMLIESGVKIYNGEYMHAYDLFIGGMGWVGFLAYKYEEQNA